MNLPPYTRAYENWLPLIARILFGAQFLMGAMFKIPMTPGFANEVAMTAAAGFPFATVAVFLAFVLEVVAGLMLVFGFRARLAGFLLAGFTGILAVTFYRDWSSMQTMGMFISHLGLIAGLLYVSVYGAQFGAVRKDELPHGVTRA
jgi:putative oxidoreductase